MRLAEQPPPSCCWRPCSRRPGTRRPGAPWPFVPTCNSSSSANQVVVMLCIKFLNICLYSNDFPIYAICQYMQRSVTFVHNTDHIMIICSNVLDNCIAQQYCISLWYCAHMCAILMNFIALHFAQFWFNWIQVTAYTSIAYIWKSFQLLPYCTLLLAIKSALCNSKWDFNQTWESCIRRWAITSILKSHKLKMGLKQSKFIFYNKKVGWI